jgi:2-polyprenyl-6-methoxyphenol hydroxylase-like FAD-dependent oxidoreductase
MDVIIAGAGPTGLAAGCLLQRFGVQTRVIDRLPAPGRLAKAMVIWSRSLEILDEIGVADEVLRRGVALETARYAQADRTVAAVATNHVPDTRWQPVILPQNLLEEVLRARYTALGGTLEWGSELVSAAQTDDRVEIGVRQADGTLSTATALYLIGCDGIRSAVREVSGIPWAEGKAYEEVFQLGDVTADSDLDRNTAHHFLGDHGVSVALPMPDGIWRVVGYLDGEEPEAEVTAAALSRLLTECGHRSTVIHEVHWSGAFRVSRRLAQTFRADRILLAGDAAHVHSPAGGQGLNTGIQDAHNLAWKLALVTRGLAGEQLLDSYTAERRPIAATILKLTQLQDQQMFGARSSFKRVIRNSALRLLSRTGVFEHKIIPDLAQLLVDYRKSALTVGKAPRRAVGRPGRRIAPELAGPNGSVRTSLYVLAGPEPGFDVTELDALAAEYPYSVRVAAAPEQLAAAVGGVRRPTVVGLRPDGHVGYRGPARVTPELRAWIHDSLALVSNPAAESTGVAG